MKKKRGHLRVLAMVLMICLGIPAFSAMAEEAPLPDTIRMQYFYDNLCGSCDATSAFDEIAGTALSDVRDLYPYEIAYLNVYMTTGAARYRQTCAEMGLDPDTLTLPLLVVGGRVFQGHEAIAANLTEAFLVAGEDLFVNGTVYNPSEKKTGPALFADYPADPDAVTLVYFYRLTCAECQQTAPVIDALADTVSVRGETVPLRVVRVNTRSGNNGERVAAFFARYAVPDAERMVPIVFTATEYFAGFEAIAEGLPGALERAKTGFAYPAAE